MAGHLAPGWRKVKSWNTRLHRRAGRRGTCLAIIALIDFGYGSGLITGYVPGFARNGSIASLPLTAWGLIWITVGAVCLTGVPLRTDRFQFSAAVLLKAAWMMVVTINWLTYHIRGGWTSVAAWGGIALLVLIISGWPEASREYL